jgi:hypothetical protein
MPPRSLRKPQVALLVNQRTLLPVFMPLAPAATLDPEAFDTSEFNDNLDLLLRNASLD